MASPNTKHGRYSKDLPTYLAAHYRAAQEDEELLSLRSSLALTESFISYMIEGLDHDGVLTLWPQLKKAYYSYQEAMARGRVAEMQQQLEIIGYLIERGDTQLGTIQQIGEQIERARRLRETEHKRLVMMQQMITSEQAMMLFGQVVDIMRKHVSDRTTLAAIQKDLEGLTASEIN